MCISSALRLVNRVSTFTAQDAAFVARMGLLEWAESISVPLARCDSETITPFAHLDF
jgi:hypothetical protein